MIYIFDFFFPDQFEKYVSQDLVYEPLPKYKNHMQVPRLRQILPPLPCVRDYSVVEELIKPDDEDGLTKHLSC